MMESQIDAVLSNISEIHNSQKNILANISPEKFSFSKAFLFPLHHVISSSKTSSACDVVFHHKISGLRSPLCLHNEKERWKKLLMLKALMDKRNRERERRNGIKVASSVLSYLMEI